MKRNLLFNQLTAIGKRLAMVLTMLLIVGIGQVWGASIEINTTNFTKTSSGSGYAVYDGTRTIAEVDIYSSNVMVQSSKLQFKSNSGLLYNTSAIPGTITKITLETTTNFTIYVGESSNPTSTKVTSGSSITGNYSYFAIKGGNNTPKTSTITIEYTPTGGNTGDGSGDIGDCNVTYDFTKINGFSSWGNSYTTHTVSYEDAIVTFTSASKQTGTITDQPVTKGNEVSLVMTDGSTLSSVTWVCKQWTTKAQTITLHYSTNGGTSYTTTGVTSTNFTISKDNLPAGTNAVKITFSSSSNQVGISSCSIEKVCNTEPTVCVIPKCGGDGGGTWLVVIEWFATF